MSEVKKIKLTLTGKVQGVFFRNFAKQTANKLGIYGYAKNMRDGSVEIVAQGEEFKLQKFIKSCEIGPMMAKVDKIDSEWLEIDPDDEFEYFDMR